MPWSLYTGNMTFHHLVQYCCETHVSSGPVPLDKPSGNDWSFRNGVIHLKSVEALGSLWNHKMSKTILKTILPTYQNWYAINRKSMIRRETLQVNFTDKYEIDNWSSDHSVGSLNDDVYVYVEQSFFCLPLSNLFVRVLTWLICIGYLL